MIPRKDLFGDCDRVFKVMKGRSIWKLCILKLVCMINEQIFKQCFSNLDRCYHRTVAQIYHLLVTLTLVKMGRNIWKCGILPLDGMIKPNVYLIKALHTWIDSALGHCLDIYNFWSPWSYLQGHCGVEICESRTFYSLYAQLYNT